MGGLSVIYKREMQTSPFLCKCNSTFDKKPVNDNNEAKFDCGFALQIVVKRNLFVNVNFTIIIILINESLKNVKAQSIVDLLVVVAVANVAALFYATSFSRFSAIFCNNVRNENACVTT
ncbi:hypothetical protein GQX74_000184 [Glossina fuscipes]|nr:hypothetical protein GQX74_000184 [Glossina fuscipes]